MSPWVSSMSRTGKTSPAAICALFTKKLASRVASSSTRPTFARWYAPTTSPFAVAPARYSKYIGSTERAVDAVFPIVARMIT